MATQWMGLDKRTGRLSVNAEGIRIFVNSSGERRGWTEKQQEFG